MSPDRGRPTRPAVIDRFRVPVRSPAPTGAGGSSDAAMRLIRTHVLILPCAGLIRTLGVRILPWPTEQ